VLGSCICADRVLFRSLPLLTTEGLRADITKWYSIVMDTDDLDKPGESDQEPAEPTEEEHVPIGIARIREEWREAGLVDEAESEAAPEEVAPVVFSEVDGGAGVGDYTLDCEAVSQLLALSHDAVERLILSGELDSVLVQGTDGAPRRLISERSLDRFREDSAIDPEAIKRAAKALADKEVAAAIDELRSDVAELKGNQGRVLQQMKDTLLLEIRNLKEQDRDLTSFVYELAEDLRDPSRKKRR
jgi:hypothetical protein